MSHPCAECGKHAFPRPGTVCFWCRDRDGTATEAERQPAGRPTIDQLRSATDPRHRH